METVEFHDVEVIDEALTGLLCRIGVRRVTIPSLLLQPGTTISRRGDDGTLVIPRWLGIGVGLVWPLSEPAARPGRAPRTSRGSDAGPGTPPRGTGRGAGCVASPARIISSQQAT
jgi:hypothetical protein